MALKRGHSLPAVIEDLTNEYLSDAEPTEKFEDHDNDMFFCCADWETQTKHSPHQEKKETFEYQTPVNKRSSKNLEKHSFTEAINN